MIFSECNLRQKRPCYSRFWSSCLHCSVLLKYRYRHIVFYPVFLSHFFCVTQDVPFHSSELFFFSFYSYLSLVSGIFFSFLSFFIYTQFPLFRKVKFLTDEVYHWAYLWHYTYKEKLYVLFYYFWVTIFVYIKNTNIPLPSVFFLNSFFMISFSYQF